MAVDIEDFSQRPVAEQAALHDDLEHAISEAAAATGLERKAWYREPRGDGELAVLPAETNGLALVADYPGRLASVLAEINRPVEHRSRLRVRMAIHHGTVYPGRFVYNEIVQSRLGELVPEMFRRARTKIKGDSFVGYLHSTGLCDARLRSSRPATTAA